MERVENLLTLHRRLHGGGRGRPPQYLSDVLRGSLVLACSALDAFILDSLLEAIPSAVRAGNTGENVLAWMRSEEDARLVIEGMGGPEPLAKLVDVGRAKLANTTFQRAGMVDGYLQGVCCASPPWQAAARWLASETSSPTSPDDVRNSLDEVVERRNRIAHEGDRPPEGKGHLRPIQRAFVEQAVLTIRAVAYGVESVLRDVTSD